jgi:hypothetical protein
MVNGFEVVISGGSVPVVFGTATMDDNTDSITPIFCPVCESIERAALQTHPRVYSKSNPA